MAQGALSLREDVIGKAVVDSVWCQHRDTRVLVLEVVPAEKALAMPFGGTDVGEPSRKIRPILECLELRF